MGAPESLGASAQPLFSGRRLRPSGRIHGEFLRLLYIIAHRETFMIGAPPSHTGSLWFASLSHCLTLISLPLALAHTGRNIHWFAQFGDDHPSDEAFKFRRGQYFWHSRSAIGHATARAVGQRVHVAEHTCRLSRAGPHTQDDLLYPPTAPLGH